MAPEPAAERVAEGVWLFASASGNSALVAGTDAALVVDAPETRAEAEAIAAAIPEGVPVKWLLRTSRRGPLREGERLLLVRGALLTGTPDALSGVAGPRLALRGTLAFHLSGARRIELREWPGATPGAAIAVVPDAGVVFGGASLPVREVPEVRSDPAAWISTLSALMQELPSAAFVPARGKSGRALDMRFLRDYLASLRRGVEHERALGKSGAPLAQALVERQRSRYGAWAGFADRAAGNIARIDAVVAREEASRRTPPPSPKPRQSSSR